MINNSKFLVLTVASFMLLIMAGCDGPTPEQIARDCHLVISTDKKEVIVGEEFVVRLQVTNSSSYSVESFRILKHTGKNARDFLIEGGRFIKGGPIERKNSMEFSFSMVALSPGKKKIASKVSWIKLNGDSKGISVPKNAGFSNIIKIDVKPVGVSLSQSLNRIEAVTGERLDVELTIANTSSRDVYSLTLKGDKGGKDFIILKDVPPAVGWIKKGEKRRIKYTVMPKSPGKKTIGAFRLTEIRYDGDARAVSVRKDTCVSNKLSIDVKPIDLTVYQTFERKRVRIGEKITSEILIKNLSKINISGFDAAYEGDSSGLKQVNPARTLKDFHLPAHGKGTISIEYKTIRAGDINLRRMIVGKLRIGDHWLNCAKPYYSNPAPMMHVESIRLPGFKMPVIFFIKEVDLYLKSFITKVVVIALGILAILLLVGLAIRSVLVDFFFGRVMLTFILVAIAELFIILFVWGLWWCFRSIFPPWWTIPVIILCCCILYTAYTFIFTSQITYKTLFPGIILGFFSYFLFVGWKAFQHHQFTNFPKEESIVVGIVLGIALNIFSLRKELRRKNG